MNSDRVEQRRPNHLEIASKSKEKPPTATIPGHDVARSSLTTPRPRCSAQVPNIFPSDERVAICEKVRPFAKEQFGRAASDMSPLQLYAYFIQRVKQYLHIILAFSPIGSAFRDRLRLFPSLVNCCAIDWFTAWPGDALLAVAEKFLKEVSLSDDVRPAIVRRGVISSLFRTSIL